MTSLPAAVIFGVEQLPLSAGVAILSSAPTQASTVVMPVPGATVVISQCPGLRFGSSVAVDWAGISKTVVSATDAAMRRADIDRSFGLRSKLLATLQNRGCIVHAVGSPIALIGVPDLVGSFSRY